ncbi:uncharacterized protein LOC118185285, partial [Stegodyphus dumicola]|uniref:uncharacterized protein LOC118185285 n=1 Tax=Stegodyphus dumicola TaxID=202533 RepID=UPI0015AEDBC6
MQYKVCKTRCMNEGILKQELSSSHQSPCTVVHIELVTSWPVTVLWILLSWLVSTLATTAYVHPEWFVKEHQTRSEVLEYDKKALVSTLGMVSVCYSGKNSESAEELECHNFGEDFPSSSWQTSYVLFGSGCVLLTWCSILAFCNVWIVGRRNRQLVAMMVGRIQLVAVSSPDNAYTPKKLKANANHRNNTGNGEIIGSAESLSVRILSRHENIYM